MRLRVADADVLPMSGALRIGAAWGLPALLEETGVSIVDVLSAAQLPPDLFSSRENFVTYPQLEALFVACERQARCDHIGLRVGQRSRLSDLGLAGELAACEETVGAGLRAFIDRFNLHDTAATCVLMESGRYARLVYTLHEYGVQDTRHFQFSGVAIAFNLIQDLCGPEFAPTKVCFACRTPTNARAFQKYFRAPVHFDREHSALIFQRQWLERPLPPVDVQRREAAATAAVEQYRRMLIDFPAIVRRIVRKRLLLGDFTMHDIAAMLSMHRRTLDRHLDAHGLQYGDLLHGVKDEIARQLLRETTISIQRVAETLRFSSAANFATAFRRRAGMSPSEYRRQTA